MSSDQKQYINFSEKFDGLASDIDDIRDLLKEVLQYNQNIIDAISDLNILSNITIKKKSRYDAKHRIKDSSELQNKIVKLENRIDMLDDDLIELKREIDDIKKILSEYKSKNEYNTLSDSPGSD